MKKSQLKALMQAVLAECKTCGCGSPDAHIEKENWVARGAEQNFTEPQKITIAKAVGMGFQLVSAYPAGGGMVAVVAKRKAGSPIEIEIGPDGKANSPMIKEMTATGAVAGYSTPFAFSKSKKGSARALAASKSLGYTPTGIEDKRNH